MSLTNEGSTAQSYTSEVATYLQEHSERLSQEIIEKINEKLGTELTDPDVTMHRASFMKLIKQIAASLLITGQERKINHGSYDEENYFFKQGVTLKETVAILSEFRLFLFDTVLYSLSDTNATKEDIALIYRHITETFDNTLKETTRRFMLLRDEMLKETMDALAAPIVPIQQGKAVLPLIGHIDTHRANHIMNTGIPRVAELKIESLIIDFSGIQIIDSFVTHHLFKITATLRLLGIEAIITGIRPALAETAVRLGINLSDLKTFATVQQALESIEHKASTQG